MEWQFNTYTGTKTVRAMAMGAAEAKRYGANLTEEVVQKNIGNNGYLVEYPDGYRSWSPARQFEEAYRISDTYLDRLKNELADLKESILKATDAIYTAGRLSPSKRELLVMQEKSMRLYADVLMERIRIEENENNSPSAIAERVLLDKEEGGD